MTIKIPGTDCPKCKTLEEIAKKAIRDAAAFAAAIACADVVVEKVTELNKIMDYGVMMTPALVIDEKVKSSGKMLTPDQIKN